MNLKKWHFYYVSRTNEGKINQYSVGRVIMVFKSAGSNVTYIPLTSRPNKHYHFKLDQTLSKKYPNSYLKINRLACFDLNDVTLVPFLNKRKHQKIDSIETRSNLNDCLKDYFFREG